MVSAGTILQSHKAIQSSSWYVSNRSVPMVNARHRRSPTGSDDTYRKVLAHPLAQPLLPLIPSALKPDPPPPSPTEPYSFNPTRLTLARWAHDIQVARAFDSMENSYLSSSGFLTPSETTNSPLESSSYAVVGGGVPLHSAALSAGGRLHLWKYEVDCMLNGSIGTGGRSALWIHPLEVKGEVGGGFEVICTEDGVGLEGWRGREGCVRRNEWKSWFAREGGDSDSMPSGVQEEDGEVDDEDEGGKVGTEEKKKKRDRKGSKGNEDVKKKKGERKLVKELKDVKARIFAGGVDPRIRHEVWPFLFGFYPWDSTSSERKAILAAKREEYINLKQRWMETAASLDEKDLDVPSSDPEVEAYRDASMRVDKDVHRTDRSHTFYTPSNPLSNPHMQSLRNVLITYTTTYTPQGQGYVQGMNDLASPFLVAFDGGEVFAFWCFANRMGQGWNTHFLHDGSGMRQHLRDLNRLVKLMDPTLHAHLRHLEADNLFCCFRWVLVAFKREFGLEDVQVLWEADATFPHLEVGGFMHLVALSILDEHRDAVLRHLRTWEEVLKYMNDLTSQIPLEPILEAAGWMWVRFVGLAKTLHVDLRDRESLSSLLDRMEAAVEKNETRRADADDKKKEK
ncbi:GTPase activating protein [Chytridiales sp. JEL 0842]|nr:GTPase activating protein [Chytridiales sp. JEL 0842]